MLWTRERERERETDRERERGRERERERENCCQNTPDPVYMLANGQVQKECNFLWTTIFTGSRLMPVFFSMRGVRFVQVPFAHGR